MTAQNAQSDPGLTLEETFRAIDQLQRENAQLHNRLADLDKLIKALWRWLPEANA